MPVHGPNEVLHWVKATKQELDLEGAVTATFIVDTGGRLWLADRQSEHVQCARGGDVLAAGEITFQVAGSCVWVSGVTNQSTGYCPDPASWPAVAASLEEAGLQHPDGFTPEFHFRRCDACDLINLVKDGCWECCVCQSPLPEGWNCDRTG